MTEAHNLDEAIAAECRRLSRAVTALEDELIAFARGESDRDALIVEIQTTDLIQQTLQDVARALEVLGRQGPTDPAHAVRVLSAIQQAALRSRLSPCLTQTTAPSTPRVAASQEIDLW